MNAAPAALRGRLRAIPPERARLQTDLIAALNSREVDDLHTTARLASTRDRRAANAWIEFSTPRGRVAIAPLLVDGTLAHMTGGNHRPDGAAAAATLGQIEPLVAALETGLGVALQPAGLSTEIAEDEMLLLRLDAATAPGKPRHRLLVAVAPGMEVAPLPMPRHMPELIAGLKPRWTARIAGPALSMRALSHLGTGDMILLGLGPLVTRLLLPGRNDLPQASVRLRDGVVELLDDRGSGETLLDRSMEAGTASGDAAQPDWNTVQLPSVIEFDGGGLTATEIAALNKGSVLPLPAEGGTIAVRVRAGDTVVADGELVAVGEGFGVLVTGLRQAPQG